MASARRGPRRPQRDPYAHYSDEHSAHRVRRPRFFIARYPVTVAQWRVYYDAADAATKSGLDPRALEGIANHPVVYVSWHDALGYCRWLTQELRASPCTPEPLATLLRRGDGTSTPWVVTLPSEAEWEKAARGVDGWRFPWGDHWDANRANAEAVATVGCFKNGRGPAGTEEQSGNVWEWTSSAYPYEFQPERGHLLASNDILRVARGGEFRLHGPEGFRAALRFRGHPFDGYDDFGFRVVVSPFVDHLLL